MYDRKKHPFETRDLRRILRNILEQTCEMMEPREINGLRDIAQEIVNWLIVCGEPVTSEVEQRAFIEEIINDVLSEADSVAGLVADGTYLNVSSAIVAEGKYDELVTNIEEKTFKGGAFGGAGATREF